MATYDYTRFVALAQRLIKKYGRDISIQKLASAGTNAQEPWRNSGSPAVSQTVETVGAFVSSGSFGTEYIREELLSRVEEVILVAPGSVALEDFEIVLDGSSRYAIDWVQVLKPGATVVLYMFGVKR